MELLKVNPCSRQGLPFECGSLSYSSPTTHTRKASTADFGGSRKQLQERAVLKAVPVSNRLHRTKFPTFSISCSPNGSLVASETSINTPVAWDEQELLLKKRADEVVTDLRGACIFLVGMMGSGKSTVGRILAEALGYYFFDSDNLIEAAAGGTSIAQIFKEKNEEGFRDKETEVLMQLSCMGRLVVATGGGIVVRPVNWSYLRQGITVWLDVPLDALAQRVVAVGTESRPLLGQTTSNSAYSQALEKLTRIYEERGPVYGNADAIVSLQEVALNMGYEDVSVLTPTNIAIEVLGEIKKLLKHKMRMDGAAGA